MTAGTTPSQTVGPFFSIGLDWEPGPGVVAGDAVGATWLRGRVLDGAGEAVPDAMVETWQAGPDGRAGGEGFRGFGRCGTDAAGRWAIRTVKPGAVEPGAAPFVAVAVFARGLLRHVVTRIYFGDEAEANAADPVLAGLDEAARATLIAAPDGDGYRFDIHLQGPRETAFFAL
jgi:protocatechuate 3,4-dioxygenase alpha subunit